MRFVVISWHTEQKTIKINEKPYWVSDQAPLGPQVLVVLVWYTRRTQQR